jgi:regulator of sigma E protease
MIHFCLSIMGLIFTILFVVGTHEAAHFMMARLLNIKVLRFSIGFGKTLWHRYDKKGTEYVLALIPLGGYVKMLDEAEGSVPAAELPYAFNRQPYYKKFLVVLAGPAMNLLCALILYWLVFVIGFVTIRPVIGTVEPQSIAAQSGLKSNQEIISIDGRATPTLMSVLLQLMPHIGNQDQLQIAVQNFNATPPAAIKTHHLNLANWHVDDLSPDPLSALGIKPYEPNIPLVIGIISPSSTVAASLRVGDKLIALNKKPLKDWSDLVNAILPHPEESMVLTIKRQDKTIEIPLTIGYQRHLFGKKSGYLGIAPTFQWDKAFLHKIQYGPLEAIPHAWQEVHDLVYINFLLFGKLFTGKLSMQSLGGPITIFDSAGTALNYGFIPFLSFLAFLSIAIGTINLLPIPGLDGAHLFIQTLEAILRRPLPERLLNHLFRLGFLLLLLVLIQALVNDILRMY